MAAASRETRLFTLRMWQDETGDGQLEWRGKVQALPQGEVYYFRGWAGLVERLEAMLITETLIPSFSLEEAQNDSHPIERDDQPSLRGSVSLHDRQSKRRADGGRRRSHMNRSRFLVIASLLGLVFGLAFLLAPAQLMSFYGISLDAAGQWIGRFLGAQLVGIAIITWLARNAPVGSALSAVMIGNLIGANIALILAVLEGLAGIGNVLIWSTAVIYAFLAAGFGYFQFGKAPQESASGPESERRVA